MRQGTWGDSMEAAVSTGRPLRCCSCRAHGALSPGTNPQARSRHWVTRSANEWCCLSRRVCSVACCRSRSTSALLGCLPWVAAKAATRRVLSVSIWWARWLNSSNSSFGTPVMSWRGTGSGGGRVRSSRTRGARYAGPAGRLRAVPRGRRRTCAGSGSPGCATARPLSGPGSRPRHGCAGVGLRPTESQ
jgi:hypothetical protein